MIRHRSSRALGSTAFLLALYGGGQALDYMDTFSRTTYLFTIGCWVAAGVAVVGVVVVEMKVDKSRRKHG